MLKEKTEKIFNRCYLILLQVMVIGVPLVFTAQTRSVFEVNKLMLIRIVSILIMGIWLFQSLLYKENEIETDNSYKFFGFQWKKIQLEIPILIWLISNILSTIFSQNIRISIFGSYDRWEGLLTVANYILIFILYTKLVKTKKQVLWLIGGIIVSTALSGFYGIFQAFGFDLINWSMDPSKRVFACINNPVHYCAYVGMVVPVGIGLHLYLNDYFHEQKKNISRLGKLALISLFIAIGLIYYNQYLSFSRATWLGFLAAMTLFYCYALKLFNQKSAKKFSFDFFITATLTASIYLIYLFRVHKINSLFAIALFSIITLSLIILWRLSHDNSLKKEVLKGKELTTTVGFILIIIVSIIYPRTEVQTLPLYLHALFSIGIIYLASLSQGERQKTFLTKLCLIVTFAQLQFVGSSLTQFLITASLLIVFCFLVFNDNTDSEKTKRYCLFSYLCLFALIILAPSANNALNSRLNPEKDLKSHFKILNTAQNKINSYKHDAIKGTARTSMWKSAIPWIKDYPILGSGLDTIKYMYPDYRRPEYGILEGGHNFTPDRLHNEYLNMLATKGFFGFIAYYLVFGLSWLLLCLKGLYRLQSQKRSFLLIGLVSGVLVYLGQVLFNFGVVATLFLLYVEMGLATAIVLEETAKERNKESKGVIAND